MPTKKYIDILFLLLFLLNTSVYLDCIYDMVTNNQYLVSCIYFFINISSFIILFFLIYKLYFYVSGSNVDKIIFGWIDKTNVVLLILHFLFFISLFIGA